VTIMARDAFGATGSTSFSVNSFVDTVNDPPFLIPSASAVGPVGKPVPVKVNPQDLEFDYLFLTNSENGVQQTSFLLDPTGAGGSINGNIISIIPNASNPKGPVLLGESVEQFGSVLRNDPFDRSEVSIGLGDGALTAPQT